MVHLKSVIVTVFARIFLNEKISIAHLICLFTSMLGVLFIGQPSLIFNAGDGGGGRGRGQTVKLQALNNDSSMLIGRVVGFSENAYFITGVSLGG